MALVVAVAERAGVSDRTCEAVASVHAGALCVRDYVGAN